MPQIETAGAHHRETTPEGIFIEWDVPIEMDDGWSSGPTSTAPPRTAGSR